jgi:2-polyprenyl-3-methyl-5-hydroxy-6-metoxy-1,4-benzoquinol methylase
MLAGYINRIARPIHLCDVGCGPGVILHHVNPTVVVKYTGIDISQTALDRFERRRNSADRLICSSIEDYSPDDRWDVILFNEILYYTRDPIEQVEKFGQALKPNGFLLISNYKKGRYFSHNNVCIRQLLRHFSAGRHKVKDAIEVTKLLSKAKWQIFVVYPDAESGAVRGF